MKRPLFWCSVLFLAGIYTTRFLPQSAAALLFFTVLLAVFLKIIITRNLYSSVIAVLIALSFIFGSVAISKGESDKSLTPYKDTSALLKLRVCEVPQADEYYCVYICDALAIVSGDNEYILNDKIRLTHASKNLSLSLGDVFSANCKITICEKPLKNGDFDYGLYLKTKGIFFTGYIKEDNINIISSGEYTVFDFFKLLNMRLCANIDSYFSQDSTTFLKAILLGEKSDMPASYYSAFKRSGLSHVIAVSGMHLSYLVMMLVVLRKLLKMGKQKFSFFMLGFIFCFMLLTGMTASALRAGIMSMCVLSGDIFIRRSDPLTSLGFSAILILAHNPYVAFSTSFILSYSATLGILIFAKPLEEKLTYEKLRQSSGIISKILKFIISTVSVSISAQLLTLPFTVIMFGETSLWALPANILITPLCPLILGFGFVFCLFSILYTPLASVFASMLSLLVTLAQLIINFFSSLDFGIIYFGKEESLVFVFMFAFALCIFLFFLYNKKRLMVFPASVLITILFFYSAYAVSSSSQAYVSFINAVRGDSTLISLTNDVNILIDGGEYFPENDGDASNTDVNRYLKRKGVKKIDFMIATHPHNDHTSGLFAVMECYDVGCLIIPSSFGNDETATKLLDKAKTLSIPVYYFKAGDSLTFSDEVTLTALMPDNYWSENSQKTNDTSLVLRFDYYDTSFLFTGDLEETGERYMMRLIDDDFLDVDVLKVGHHGSSTSSSQEFIYKTTPKFAFIPSGENSFGFPSDEVLDRLKNANTHIFRADLNGDVIFVLTTEGINNIIYN